jgi:hypothetical protein
MKNNILFPAIIISIIKFPNKFILIKIRYIFIFNINFIIFIDLRPHKFIFDWKFIKYILYIGNRTVRITKYKKL